MGFAVRRAMIFFVQIRKVAGVLHHVGGWLTSVRPMHCPREALQHRIQLPASLPHLLAAACCHQSRRWTWELKWQVCETPESRSHTQLPMLERASICVSGPGMPGYFVSTVCGNIWLSLVAVIIMCNAVGTRLLTDVTKTYVLSSVLVRVCLLRSCWRLPCCPNLTQATGYTMHAHVSDGVLIILLELMHIKFPFRRHVGCGAAVTHDPGVLHPGSRPAARPPARHCRHLAVAADQPAQRPLRSRGSRTVAAGGRSRGGGRTAVAFPEQRAQPPGAVEGFAGGSRALRCRRRCWMADVA